MIKNFPEDYMSDKEWEEYQMLEREPIAQTSAAQKQEEARRRKTQEYVHDALKEVQLSELFPAILAHLEARADVDQNSEHLCEFSNLIGRMAWKYE